MEWTFSLKDIREIATSFWKTTGDTTVYAFHGEMGAGKTTFIHALCDVKGVKSTVGSPTFSIINEYNFAEGGSTHRIYHLDLYRLKSEEEAIQAGVEDCLYSGSVCFVEWPDRAPRIFPPETLHVFIEATGAENRKLRIGHK